MLALILTLASTIILPLTRLEWASVPFLVLAAMTLVFASGSKIKQVRYKPGLTILLFWLACFAHMAFVFAGEVSVSEYVRGLVPFLFLIFFYAAVRLTSVQNFHSLYYALIGIGLAYAAQNLVLLPKFLSGEVWRTTFENGNHSIPFPVVGFHCCVALLLGRRTEMKLKVLLLAAACLLLLSSLLTGTRSLIIASLLPLLAVPFAGVGANLGKWFRYGFTVALLGLIFVFVPTDTLLKSSRIGWSQAGSINTRMQENEVASALIARSPIVGNGLGFRFDTNGLYYQSTRVGYVHNSLLYLLMDFGIFGLLYVAGPLYALRSLALARSGPHKDYVIGLTMALLGLLIFSLGFAMVRLMHFNLLMAVVMGMLEALKRDYALHWHGQRARFKAYLGQLRRAGVPNLVRV